MGFIEGRADGILVEGTDDGPVGDVVGLLVGDDVVGQLVGDVGATEGLFV